MTDSKSQSRSRSPPRKPAKDSDSLRDRSRSPRRSNTDRSEKRRSRTRSKSPMRKKDEAGDKKQDFSKAFKYKSKDKKQQDGERASDEKSYRQRDDSYRPSRYGGGDKSRGEDRNRRDDGDSRVADKFGNSVKDKFGGGGGSKKITDKFGNSAPKREEKPKAPATPAGPVTYILVTVNDRLGTKATIPCMGSDTVGDFKKMVAAHIGRQPHEIMLKRQGERPFKDFITLADYGVGSGVQLDLELDTGE